MRKGRKKRLDRDGAFYLRRKMLERKAMRQYFLDKVREVFFYVGGAFGVFYGLSLLAK